MLQPAEEMVRAVEEAKEDDVSALEELALTAGRAIEKSRQLRELHELGKPALAGRGDLTARLP